jgi:hypothetical protein
MKYRKDFNWATRLSKRYLKTARFFMVDKRVINEWLVKAQEDFGFASSVLDDSIYYAQI